VKNPLKYSICIAVENYEMALLLTSPLWT